MSNSPKFQIADLHCDTVLPMQRGYDISKRNDNNHIDIPRLQEGGVNVQVFATTSIYVDENKSHFDNVNKQIDLLHSEFGKHPEQIEICLSSDDITRVNSEGKIAAVLAIEGGQAFDNKPANIEYFYNKGIRLITIAHEKALDWCAYHKEPDAKTRGLNDSGREMIAEMNRLGIIIDLSHSGDKTAEDVLAISSTPVIASHSNARNLSNHTRNLPDDLIKGIAESGGMIGITFVNNFISEEYDKAYEQFWSLVPREKLTELLKLYTMEIPEKDYRESLERDFKFIIEGEQNYQHLKPSIKEIIDHLDYMKNLIGIEHIGLGSDFDGISSTPIGLENCSKIQGIAKELLSRNYDENQIRKICKDNFLRVFRSVCG